jgi:pimeloyl-ACP methyl ester carboxylesterase
MQKQINHNGCVINYRVTGNGKPVVLLHGFGEDSNIWKYQVEFLKDTFQLIVPDLPGSGMSIVDSWQLTVGSNHTSIEWLAESIKSVLEAEKITSCSMIGHSMGGYITLAFAEKYPEWLNKFGLFHSSAYADNEEKIQTRRRGIEFIKEHGAYLFLKQSTPNLFGKKFTAEHPTEIATLIEEGHQFSATSLIQYYEAMIARPDRTAVLKNAAVPVLFIIGAEDKAAPMKDCLEQCHLPSLSHVHILEHSAHMGMWEETDKANLFIGKFLSF